MAAHSQSANVGTQSFDEVPTANSAELSEMKRNFVSNVSHELRSPLQVMMNYLSLMQERAFGELSTEQKEALAAMDGATRQLRQLIENLIHYADAASDSLSLQLQPVQLIVPVQTAVRRSLPKARERQLAVQTQLAPYIPAVQADNQKITWVIGELLENAIKYTPQGGQVSLTAERDRSEVTVEVVDTGIGIPADRLSEIFEPFHQLDSSTTRAQDGMGLGLALAQRIVRAHGSSLEVSSTPGLGSAFSFSLPLIV